MMTRIQFVLRAAMLSSAVRSFFTSPSAAAPLFIAALMMLCVLIPAMAQEAMPGLPPDKGKNSGMTPESEVCPSATDSNPSLIGDSSTRTDSTEKLINAENSSMLMQSSLLPDENSLAATQNLQPEPDSSSAPSASSHASIADTSCYIPLSEFTIAGTPRYTIDNSPPMKCNKLKPLTTVGIGATYFGILTALHIYQVNTIWNENTKFRIVEDFEQDFMADKCGHFWGTYFNGYCSAEALIGAGFSVETATIVGGLMGLLYQGYVEVMDGFGKNWGFSPSDMYADIAGFGYYLAQYYVPFLQNFTFKATYFPASWYNEKPRREASMFIDDYSSWTWWLSAKMCNLTPASWKWPRWLDLAFGYAARDLHLDPDGYKGKLRFSLALDYNIVELLPDGGNFFNWLKQSFNYFKFPAPAIEFGEGVRFRLFYPFVISFGTSFKF